MQIIVAPNAFKNSLAAGEVAEAIRAGLEKSQLPCEITCFPVGDGGDGTGELLVKHFKGKVVAAEVHDPLGRIISSSFGLIEHGKTAVVEMANASGIRLLKHEELNPLKASSFGTGELILKALDHSVSRIIICLGGSATVDGGAGILRALGIKFLSRGGVEITGLPGNLEGLDAIDLSGLDKRLRGCKLTVLCDVKNQLLGEHGAAMIFGPQKGAKQADVLELEKGLARFREVVLRETGNDMALVSFGGAAGGVAAGLSALLNAELENGIDFFLSYTGFAEALGKADVVITGEGSIDLQTLDGKGPFGVAKKAKEKNLKVIGLAGKIPPENMKQLDSFFDVLLCINEDPMDLQEAMSQTKINLERTAMKVGNLLAAGKL